MGVIEWSMTRVSHMYASKWQYWHFGTNGTSGHSNQFKLIRYFLSTERWPAQYNQLYDIIGYSIFMQQKWSHLILAPNCLVISITDILRCFYLILCHLPYNTYNMFEISIVYDNLFSKTIIHYNMSYTINLNINKTNKNRWKAHL